MWSIIVVASLAVIVALRAVCPTPEPYERAKPPKVTVLGASSSRRYCGLGLLRQTTFYIDTYSVVGR